MALGEGSPDWLTPGWITIRGDGSTYFHELAAETVRADEWIQDIPVPRDERQLEWDGEQLHDIPGGEPWYHKSSPFCGCKPSPDKDAEDNIVWHHYTEEESA